MITLTTRDYYLAIIGDLIRSREIPDRAKFQRQFHQTMEKMNQQFAEVIVSPFTVTLGDEFQAVLKSAHRLFEIFDLLDESFLPQQAVMGIGIGTIETEIYTHTSIGMDGPCFRLARAQIEQAKKQPPRRRFAMEGLNIEVVNSLSWLLEILTGRQTPRQKEIIRLYRQLGNQKQVARELNISQAAVSKALKGGYYDEIESGRQTLMAFLNQFIQ